MDILIWYGFAHSNIDNIKCKEDFFKKCHLISISVCCILKEKVKLSMTLFTLTVCTIMYDRVIMKCLHKACPYCIFIFSVIK